MDNKKNIKEITVLSPFSYLLQTEPILAGSLPFLTYILKFFFTCVHEMSEVPSVSNKTSFFQGLDAQ